MGKPTLESLTATKRVSNHVTLMPFIWACVLIGGIWAVSWGLIVWGIEDWQDRGTFGDMFGAANCLFSGMALAGVVYAILLQRSQVLLQVEDLEATREELRQTKEVHKSQVEGADDHARTRSTLILLTDFFSFEHLRARDLAYTWLRSGPTNEELRDLDGGRPPKDGVRPEHVYCVWRILDFLELMRVLIDENELDERLLRAALRNYFLLIRKSLDRVIELAEAEKWPNWIATIIPAIRAMEDRWA
jgi:hypothetical protein